MFHELSVYWACSRNLVVDRRLRHQADRIQEQYPALACTKGTSTASRPRSWSYWLHWQPGARLGDNTALGRFPAAGKVMGIFVAIVLRLPRRGHSRASRFSRDFQAVLLNTNESGSHATPFRCFVIRRQSVEVLTDGDAGKFRVLFPHENSLRQFTVHPNGVTNEIETLRMNVRGEGHGGFLWISEKPRLSHDRPRAVHKLNRLQPTYRFGFGFHLDSRIVVTTALFPGLRVNGLVGGLLAPAFQPSSPLGNMRAVIAAVNFPIHHPYCDVRTSNPFPERLRMCKFAPRSFVPRRVPEDR